MILVGGLVSTHFAVRTKLMLGYGCHGLGIEREEPQWTIIIDPPPKSLRQSRQCQNRAEAFNINRYPEEKPKNQTLLTEWSVMTKGQQALQDPSTLTVKKTPMSSAVGVTESPRKLVPLEP